jgi:hypothetical protein
MAKPMLIQRSGMDQLLSVSIFALLEPYESNMDELVLWTYNYGPIVALL